MLETEFSHLEDQQRKSDAVAQVIQDALEPRDSAARGEGWSCDRIMRHRQSFVSEELFRNEYWRHFPQGLTKGLGK